VSGAGMSSLLLRCGPRSLDLSRPRVMGVLNLTPDSFSDGGELLLAGGLAGSEAPALDLDALLRRADAMVRAGADLLDVGAESTRPGASPVDPAVEEARVTEAVRQLGTRFDAVVSVDTSAPRVMRAAAEAGAGLINDVRALRAEGAPEAAAATGLPVCLMHMQGSPADMQRNPRYDQVVGEIAAFLGQRLAVAEAAGIVRERLLLDPGFGFGKTLRHNLTLLRGLDRIVALGRPVVVGLSRKRMIGELTGRDVGERVAGSVAAALVAVEAGARIVRAHDVAPTVDALNVAWGVWGDSL